MPMREEKELKNSKLHDFIILKKMRITEKKRKKNFF